MSIKCENSEKQLNLPWKITIEASYVEKYHEKWRNPIMAHDCSVYETCLEFDPQGLLLTTETKLLFHQKIYLASEHEPFSSVQKVNFLTIRLSHLDASTKLLSRAVENWQIWSISLKVETFSITIKELWKLRRSGHTTSTAIHSVPHIFRSWWHDG